MRKKTFRSIFIISLLFTFLIWYQCLTDTNYQFQSFTRALFQKELATNTISLHYTLKDPSAYQLEGMPVSFGGVSTDVKKTFENIASYQDTLSKFDLHTLSSENKLTHQILSSYLETAARGCEYLLYQEPFSPVIGIHAQLPLLLSEFAFYDSGDIDTYLELLGETPNYFANLIDFEKEKAATGLFMPDYQVDAVISFCQSFLDMGTDNYLFSSFEERLKQVDGLTSEKMKSYLTLNQAQVEHKVFPAYENLIGQLRLLKGSGTNEMGLCYLPKGKEYYEHLTHQQTGIRASVPTLQAMAETQISQDAKDVQKYFAKDVEASSDLLLENVTSILDSLKKKSASAFPQIPQVNTQVKFVPSDMEDFLSPAFYMIPPIDTFSENVIYINKAQTPGGISLFTTLAHEGYPGHLYQTVYFASKNPDPIRSILDYGGYVEGWATYAEMMSYYMAPMKRSEALLFQKNASIVLGVYALADMGIHYDGWSLEDTINHFASYGLDDPDSVKEIYELIIGTPGNYLKYYLGYVSIYQLKKEIAWEMGDDFSQKKFHEALLDVGPAPFDIVEEYVRKEFHL